MAYVKKIGDRWKAEVRVMIDGVSRGATQRFDTKSAADQWAVDKERELRTMRDGGFPRKTVRDLFVRWREEIAPTRDGEKWDVNRLKKLERHLVELGFADMQLQEFGPRHMAALRRDRLKITGPSSVAREESLMRGVWKTARHPDWHWTDVDPFKDLGGIKGSSGKPRTRKAEPFELKRILRQLGYHPRRPETTKKAQTGLAMMVALRTTLRSQEVLQLSDESINLDKLVITIGQHKTRYRTNEAKRVSLLPKGYVLMRRKCLGKGAFFTVSPGSRDKLFREAKVLAGVPDLTFHDLKRTAVLALKKVLTKEQIMAVTGNMDEDTLQRHYMTDTCAESSRIAWRALGVDPIKLLSSSLRSEDLAARMV